MLKYKGLSFSNAAAPVVGVAALWVINSALKSFKILNRLQKHSDNKFTTCITALTNILQQIIKLPLKSVATVNLGIRIY